MSIFDRVEPAIGKVQKVLEKQDYSYAVQDAFDELCAAIDEAESKVNGEASKKTKIAYNHIQNICISLANFFAINGDNETSDLCMKIANKPTSITKATTDLIREALEKYEKQPFDKIWALENAVVSAKENAKLTEKTLRNNIQALKEANNELKGMYDAIFEISKAEIDKEREKRGIMDEEYQQIIDDNLEEIEKLRDEIVVSNLASNEIIDDLKSENDDLIDRNNELLRELEPTEYHDKAKETAKTLNDELKEAADAKKSANLMLSVVDNSRDFIGPDGALESQRAIVDTFGTPAAGKNYEGILKTIATAAKAEIARSPPGTLNVYFMLFVALALLANIGAYAMHLGRAPFLDDTLYPAITSTPMRASLAARDFVRKHKAFKAPK